VVEVVGMKEVLEFEEKLNEHTSTPGFGKLSSEK
jgi:hypothetical protein